MNATTQKQQLKAILEALEIDDVNAGASTGIKWYSGTKEKLTSFSPVDGEEIADIQIPDKSVYERVIRSAHDAFKHWRLLPAPGRGELIRQIGLEFRKYKHELGTLITYEMGKSIQEGWGEVQEMIDICDFSVGLSRQLYGYSMHSERLQHRMYEQYHPLGIVGIITAFNFPVAVWSWNAMIALACGDVCIWKPSEKVPLCAIACQKIVARVFERNDMPDGISNLLIGDYRPGQFLANNNQIPLISATGSTRMGRSVGQSVGSRLGRSILELGGNNAIIISQYADLEMALHAAVFGAIGTAGQRCTTTRRLIIQDPIYEQFKKQLKHAYEQIKIGNPLNENNHMGPMIDKEAVAIFISAMEEIKKQGGIPVIEGKALTGREFGSGCYVQPAIYEVNTDLEILQHETFVPILYLLRYKDIEEAVEIQNAVPQGLSSSIMSNNLRETEYFLSEIGSDCGIANVNIGTSGAEIGGAFGGEKDTGGGRESGSDAWKFYMRRQTNTINYGRKLPLAQGIQFKIC